ncbi:MAG: ABC transporter ATP-binding protein [Acidimicrobiia bacterium]|nr:ABC transporter ATP-binding protein [Acidimicrobiia bacterium]
MDVVRDRLLSEVLPEAGTSVEGPVLEVKDIHLSFAGVKAIDGVSFQVSNHELFAIIGPNGAGKTSIFNSISGVYEPQEGSIRFMGKDILGGKPDHIARMGMARTFQNIELFANLTVLDNIMLGRHLRMNHGVLSSMVWLGKARKAEMHAREVAEGIIQFLELEPFRKSYVAMLPYGVQKRVELGRALAMSPSLLLLDEPAAGMNTEETEDMARFIMDIKRELGIGMILVEHDMRVVMDLADTVLAIDFGKPISLGTPDVIQRNPDVIRAYLGQDHAVVETGGTE